MSRTIAVANLAFEYRLDSHRLRALREISFSVNPGEFVAILGPSGCGKSTLLRIIGGLLDGWTGEVTIDGRSPNEARKNRLFGFVFQKPVLFGWRTVLQNVMLPFEVSKFNGQPEGNDGVQVLARAMTKLVGLDGFEASYPRQLSGGMQSRVAIARALSFRPSILLMDEPFGNLDELTRSRMDMELMRVQEATNATIVFVTHSISEAVLLADKVIVMTPRPGRIKEVLDIDFERPRRLDILGDPEFNRYSAQLRIAMGMQN